MGWVEFIAALITFFISHSLPVRPANRAALVQRLGQAGFTLTYSALSLAVLIWLIGAAGRAPFVPLWDWAPWQNIAVLAIMALACVILAFTLGRPNPFSFGGTRHTVFDPTNPGLIRLIRHPLLWALGLWALAHMIPNGNLAHVLLFGIFASFAFLGQRIIDRRKQRQMGDNWARLWGETRAARPKLQWHPWRWVGAALLYTGLLWLHPIVIGVSPLP